VQKREASAGTLTGGVPPGYVALRDRALIGLMAYTFARVGAALSMNVGDYYPEGKQWSVRLREKGGKRKQIAVHHVLEEYMDAYLDAHSYAHEWYIDSILNHDPRGFSRSPFMPKQTPSSTGARASEPAAGATR